MQEKAALKIRASIIKNGNSTKNHDIFVYPDLHITSKIYVHIKINPTLKMDNCCDSPMGEAKDGSKINAKILITDIAR